MKRTLQVWPSGLDLWKLGVRLKRSLVVLAMALLALTGCTSEPWGCGMGAACPSMADVSGVRYGVSGAQNFVGIEPHLEPFGRISQSNVSPTFADDIALAVEGVDPTAFLLVRNRVTAEEPEAFRALWSMADDPFPAALCQFVDDTRRAAYPDCQ